MGTTEKEQKLARVEARALNIYKLFGFEGLLLGALLDACLYDHNALIKKGLRASEESKDSFPEPSYSSLCRQLTLANESLPATLSDAVKVLEEARRALDEYERQPQDAISKKVLKSLKTIVKNREAELVELISTFEIIDVEVDSSLNEDQLAELATKYPGCTIYEKSGKFFLSYDPIANTRVLFQLYQLCHALKAAFHQKNNGNVFGMSSVITELGTQFFNLLEKGYPHYALVKSSMDHGEIFYPQIDFKTQYIFCFSLMAIAYHFAGDEVCALKMCFEDSGNLKKLLESEKSLQQIHIILEICTVDENWKGCLGNEDQSEGYICFLKKQFSDCQDPKELIAKSTLPLLFEWLMNRLRERAYKALNNEMVNQMHEGRQVNTTWLFKVLSHIENIPTVPNKTEFLMDLVFNIDAKMQLTTFQDSPSQRSRSSTIIAPPHEALEAVASAGNELSLSEMPTSIFFAKNATHIRNLEKLIEAIVRDIVELSVAHLESKANPHARKTSYKNCDRLSQTLLRLRELCKTDLKDKVGFVFDKLSDLLDKIAVIELEAAPVSQLLCDIETIYYGLARLVDRALDNESVAIHQANLEDPQLVGAITTLRKIEYCLAAVILLLKELDALGFEFSVEDGAPVKLEPILKELQDIMMKHRKEIGGQVYKQSRYASQYPNEKIYKELPELAKLSDVVISSQQTARFRPNTPP
jgi:hypothetical protein